MAQFLVLAHLATDAAVEARRLAALPAHSQIGKPMIERGEVFFGAAILDGAGKTVSHVMFVDFPSRGELDEWLAREPFVTKGVWQNIEVKPVQVAVANGKGPCS